MPAAEDQVNGIPTTINSEVLLLCSGGLIHAMTQ